MNRESSAPVRHTGRARIPIPLAAWGLILPSLILAVAIIGYPFYQIAVLSVSDVSRFGLVRGFARDVPKLGELSP